MIYNSARITPKYYKLSSVQVCWARLASFGQFCLHSDPQIPKLKNETNDPKGLENKIYTMMKGRETFYDDYTVPITNFSEVQYVYLIGYPMDAVLKKYPDFYAPDQ